MSKETAKKVNELKKKHPKQKLTAFDIIAKIVTVALAVAIFPIAYFKEIFYIEIAHSQSYTYEKIAIADIPEIYDLLQMFTTGNEDYFKKLIALDIYRPVIVALVFLAIALILAFAIVIVTIVCRKLMPTIILSASAVVSMIISYGVFSLGFAKPALDGEITIAQLLNTSNYLVSIVLGLVGKISAIRFDTAFMTIFFLLVAIFIWTISVHIVNLGEKEEK